MSSSSRITLVLFRRPCPPGAENLISNDLSGLRVVQRQEHSVNIQIYKCRRNRENRNFFLGRLLYFNRGISQSRELLQPFFLLFIILNGISEEGRDYLGDLDVFVGVVRIRVRLCRFYIRDFPNAPDMVADEDLASRETFLSDLGWSPQIIWSYLPLNFAWALNSSRDLKCMTLPSAIVPVIPSPIS